MTRYIVTLIHNADSPELTPVDIERMFLNLPGVVDVTAMPVPEGLTITIERKEVPAGNV